MKLATVATLIFDPIAADVTKLRVVIDPFAVEMRQLPFGEPDD